MAILDLKQDDADKAANELQDLFGWYFRLGMDISLMLTDSFLAGDADVRGFACDVANEESVQGVFQEVVDRWGKVDTLVASAG